MPSLHLPRSHRGAGEVPRHRPSGPRLSPSPPPRATIAATTWWPTRAQPVSDFGRDVPTTLSRTAYPRRRTGKVNATLQTAYIAATSSTDLRTGQWHTFGSVPPASGHGTGRVGSTVRPPKGCAVASCMGIRPLCLFSDTDDILRSLSQSFWIGANGNGTV
jgi:hypothetical protein